MMELPVTKAFELEPEILKKVFNCNFVRNKDSKHDNITEFNSRELSQEQELNSLLRYVDRTFELTGRGYKFQKLWLVESKPKDIVIGELPYIPHIDYNRFLKVMIYVDRVDEFCGPFSAYRIDPNKLEEMRLSLKYDYKTNKENRINAFPLMEYKAFTGAEGTMILFDTNCPHFAGEVEVGYSRRVFRFDFSLPEWDRRDGFVSRVRRKLKI